MNRWSLTHIIAVAALVGACADDPAQPDAFFRPQLSKAMIDGRYIVDLNGAGPADLAASVAALGGTVEYVHTAAGIATVSGLTPTAATALASVSGVGGVFRDVDFQLAPQLEDLGVEEASVEVNSPANPTTAVAYSFQWNMRRIGANTAWAAGKLGASDVTIAILDTGIDTENLDMAGRVDLTRSVSFVPSDTAFLKKWLPTRPEIEDLNGHGTNVATQASSNAVYFAGVNSRTTLLAIKVLGRTGGGTLSGILNGLIYAADNGADVANMSLGVARGVDKRESGQFLGITNKIFNYAHRQGMVVVVSAGNDTINMTGAGRIFTAYCEAPHVICVSATGPTASTNPFVGPWTNQDALAPYSNFGDKITVAAPGGTNRGLVSSVCARRRVTGFAVVPPDTVPTVPIFGCLTPTPNTAAILGAAGTSQASPHVAGLAAKLVEQCGKNNPSLIKEALINGSSVDDLGPVGKDNTYGYGRINVAKAMSVCSAP
jgi:lantibiotic leader peptide-processing serine protease